MEKKKSPFTKQLSKMMYYINITLKIIANTS